MLSEAIAALQEYCFTVSEGLVNPETTKPPTESFLFSIKTGEGYLVDESDSGIFAQPYLSAGPFNAAAMSSSGPVVGDAALITVELDLKSSLPIGSKFHVKLPNSVFYLADQSAEPQCKESAQSSFGACMQVTVAQDQYGDYLSEVRIASTQQAYNAGDIVTLQIQGVLNKFNSQQLDASLLQAVVKSIDDNEYTINSSIVAVELPELTPNNGEVLSASRTELQV